jgi:nicotinamide mononucleotide transporter
VAFVAAGTIALGTVMANIHELLPRLFPDPAALPFLDAFTTVMSFTAQILMAYRKLESWCLWILVDVIGIWLYHDRGVTFISVLYGVFLVLALRGLLEWLREMRQNERPVRTRMAIPATAN